MRSTSTLYDKHRGQPNSTSYAWLVFGGSTTQRDRAPGYVPFQPTVCPVPLVQITVHIRNKEAWKKAGFTLEQVR
jgi:hypothetical protein